MTVAHYLPDTVLSIRDGILRSVYDGSFDKLHGTAVWCLEVNEGIIHGVNIVLLGSDTLDFTRRELASIYKILKVINCIIFYYKLDSSAIEIV